MQQTKDVVSHWHQLIDGLQLSPLECYTALEEALKARQIPTLRTRRITWNESGVLSPKREYLRILGDRHCYDVCAAPFGRGFFFSSWLTKRRAGGGALYVLGMGAAAAIMAQALGVLVRAVGLGGAQGSWLFVGLDNFALLFALSFLILLWVVALAAKTDFDHPELAILEVPVLGWLYRALFVPETYYRQDTMLMFQSAVHSALMEIVNDRLSAKGLRALAPDQQTPTSVHFAAPSVAAQIESQDGALATV